MATKEIAWDVKVSRRRVKQIIKAYKESGQGTLTGGAFWSSLQNRLQNRIEKYGIKQILAIVKHPQTNRKLERFFCEDTRHRSAFSSFEDFIRWYNDRPHGSLDLERIETPEMAFRQKMPLEACFAIAHRLPGL
ncbi:MAG: hypothetical protein NQU42_05965 [Methanothrix sp.]|uniref:hypothetical protein n=1 Tax=Methanothrix sp. TaxID=90426 RepID=UPI0025D0439B|nr:hypothetical protein [Methanothrix sp.]MCQ8903619.1 hypothetical protein [Methanothrix sp.]